MSYFSNQVEPGSLSGSVINLTASTISATTITIPYIMAINGVLGGMFWTLAGAGMTYYSSRLLIECSEITGKSGYEKLANAAFGKKWKKMVGVSQLITMLGFVVAYLTLVFLFLLTFLEFS